MSAQDRSTRDAGEPSLAELAAGFRRRGGAVLGWTLAGGAVALAVALMLRPTYVAEARLHVQGEEGSAGMAGALVQIPIGLAGLIASNTSTAAEVEFLRSRPALEAVVLPRGASSLAPDVGLDLLTVVNDLDRARLGRVLWRKLRSAAEPEGSLEVEIMEWDYPEEDEVALTLEFLPGGMIEITRGTLWLSHEERLAFVPGEPIDFEGARFVLRPAGDLSGRSFEIQKRGLQRSVDCLKDSLVVQEWPRGSAVIEVAIPDSDPARAAATANALVRAYLAQNRARQRERAGTSAGFLEAELERVRADLAASEQELMEFGARSMGVVLPEAAVALVEKLAEVDLEKARASYTRRFTEGIVSRIDAGELSESDLAALETLQPSFPGVVEPLAALLQRLAALEAEYTDEWPELVAVRAEVASRSDAVRTALTRKLEAESQLEVDLDAILARYQERLDAFPEAQVELLRFQRRVEALSQIYLFLLGRAADARLRERSAVPSVEIVEWAVTPLLRDSPVLRVVLAIGLVLGLALGSLVALLAELRRPVATSERLSEALASPVLGELAPPNKGARLVLRDRPNSARAEDLRALRAAILHATAGRQASTLLVVGLGDARAGIRLGADLGVALALSGRTVRLVDASLERQALGPFFPAQGKGGFAEALLGLDPIPLLTQSGIDGLALLAAGEKRAEAREKLAGARARGIFASLAGAGEMVLVVAPPPGSSATAQALAASVDGVIVVVRQAALGERELAREAQRLVASGARILGGVLERS